MNAQQTAVTVMPQQAIVGLQQTIDWKDPELKALIKNTVAKGATDNELAYFCLLANSKKLNPLNKEIYFSAYGEGQGRKSFVMIGRHGMLTLAERHPEFEGLSSCEIRAKDDFSFNPITGEINHVIKLPKSEIIGAWATARRKGRQPVTIVCWMDEYIKEKSEAWQKYKQDMIKFKAEKRVLEQLFKAEYQGLMVGDDYENLEPPTFEQSYSPAPAIATVEDWIGDDKPAAPAQEASPNHITDLQRKRMFAIAKSDKELVKQIIKKYGYESTSDVLMSDYEAICKDLEDPYAEFAEMETGVPKLPDTLEEAVKQQALGVGASSDTSYLEG